MYHSLVQRLDESVALDGDSGEVPSVLSPPGTRNKKRKTTEAAEQMDILMADEIKYSRKAMQSFNFSLLQDKVYEAEDKLQEALDCKEELENGGENYSEAMMRRCEKRIFTCRKRRDDRMKSLEKQEEEMKI